MNTEISSVKLRGERGERGEGGRERWKDGYIEGRREGGGEGEMEGWIYRRKEGGRGGGRGEGWGEGGRNDDIVCSTHQWESKESKQ